ncbi:hypothetical protein Nepgr_013466 [Nepenthes gracilis]|uniref:Uncharacterized protein n=1 Tax=Nepenthes gracilis TaxID=150966 RepID=A0AAD3XPF5_NEPGR|nr:hypothetical protein Nepgr_013466 [Nepenthes gracilis]
MVSDTPMTEDVASAPPSVVAGDCQSALLFACSESNLVESKLKEERDCSSSGSESASSLLPPSTAAVVGLDTNRSAEDRRDELLSCLLLMLGPDENANVFSCMLDILYPIHLGCMDGGRQFDDEAA